MDYFDKVQAAKNLSYLFSLIFGAGGSFCSAFGLICMKLGNINIEG